MEFVIFGSLPTFLVPLILVGAFGLIVILVIILKRKTKLFSGDDKKKSDKEIAEEELNRILEPVDEKDFVPADKDKKDE